MENILVTPRLTLRRFTPADVAHLHELDSDPEVMRYLTNGRPTPLTRIRDGILPALLAEYDRDPGYGRWAAMERSSGEFVGWLALRQRPDRTPGDVELGYRLRRSVWGRGYATEGARALVDHGFGELGAGRIFAETMAVNLASRRVLEKAGLRWVRTFHLSFDDPIPGTELGEVEYALTRHDRLRLADRAPDRPVPPASAAGAGRSTPPSADGTGRDGTGRPASPEAARCVIRPARPADYDAIAGVIDDWWGRSVLPGLPRVFLDHFHHTSLVAEDPAGRLRGFLIGVIGEGDPDRAYIHYVGVDPAARGGGLARRLYGRFTELARTHLRQSLRAVTSPGNQDSVAFHRRLGFTVIGPVAGYNGPDRDRYVFDRPI